MVMDSDEGPCGDDVGPDLNSTTGVLTIDPSARSVSPVSDGTRLTVDVTLICLLCCCMFSVDVDADAGMDGWPSSGDCGGGDRPNTVSSASCGRQSVLMVFKV